MGQTNLFKLTVTVTLIITSLGAAYFMWEMLPFAKGVIEDSKKRQEYLKEKGIRMDTVEAFDSVVFMDFSETLPTDIEVYDEGKELDKDLEKIKDDLPKE